MKSPRVSVIMPAYNAEAFIEQAIQSVVQQTMMDLELIVVDDQSSDGTNSIIAENAMNDTRIRHIRATRNVGPGAARNLAIREARGEWVAMLDADDWYEETRLEKLLDAAETYKVLAVADNQKFITTAGERARQYLLEKTGKEIHRISADDYLRGDRLERTSRNLWLLKPMIKRSLLVAYNIRYDQHRDVAMGEDFYFLLHCLRHCSTMILVEEPLYNYCRLSPTSHTKIQSIDGFIAVRYLHERYKNLFDINNFPVTIELMEKRRLDIERYIRFKNFVELLKKGEFFLFLRQIKNDPYGFLLLIHKAARDPGAVILLMQYLGQHTRRRLT